jgi:16S rRNA (cytosine1402-N4)-methyltransferase
MDSNSTPQKPKRRPRYSGKNPRHFHEKYKEHRPEQYPETIQKVLESGKTPAGSHRPIMVAEILEVLRPQAGEIAVDATLGYGAHASEILPKLAPGGRLIGIDTDPIELPRTEARLREKGFSSEVLIVCQTNYASLPQILKTHEISGVDLVLADLGCSSMQFDDPSRGFSYKLDGPLDLRMNPNKGRSASKLLENVSSLDLEQMLIENADEPHSDIIARAIVGSRERALIQTTKDLTQVLERTLSRIQPDEREVSIRRVYQALRIEVNDEFSALEQFLRVLPDCLNTGGRAAILSFHSGEDRRVKKAFQTGLREGKYLEISDEIVRPSSDEIRSNPRSSSAKLRWAVK